MTIPTDLLPSSDKSLQPFLAPTFDPADYLNSVLPTWTPPSSSSSSSTTTKPAIYGPGHSFSAPSNKPESTSLADVANQTLAIITQLDAQLTRLSSTLTALTDEILRSGGRLGYEVEVLRGDAEGLGDGLVRGLRADVGKFTHRDGDGDGVAGQMERLHMLTTVRDKLDAVVKVFGRASEWPVRPSEVVSRGFVSGVSEAGEGEREERAGKWERGIREELGAADVDAALARVDEFRRLAEVWKGTAEERARVKFVEGLAKMVEERKKMESGGGYALPKREK